MNGIICWLVVLAFAPAGSKTASKDVQFFDARVAPILAHHCLGCHSNQLNGGGISFENRDTLIKGGRRGAAIAPGKPEQSVLIQAVRQDGNLKMPPGGKLSAKDVATLTEWIRGGAGWGSKVRRKH